MEDSRDHHNASHQEETSDTSLTASWCQSHEGKHSAIKHWIERCITQRRDRARLLPSWVSVTLSSIEDAPIVQGLVMSVLHNNISTKSSLFKITYKTEKERKVEESKIFPLSGSIEVNFLEYMNKKADVQPK